MKAVTLNDKFTVKKGKVLLNGTQALVRVPMLQIDLDRKNKHNSACFLSGYRGSPLAGIDLTQWRAKKFQDDYPIHFTPGINEDLAATSVWGSQQGDIFDGYTYDGVFGIWYGKGPGVDRSGDAIKHGNFAGSHPKGGVLLYLGDDHGCRSSTLPHQSEQALISFHLPVLNPANIQEFLDYGLAGIAISRFSGCWVGLKTIEETVNATERVEIDLDRYHFVTPEIDDKPKGGYHIRWPDIPVEQEKRQAYKLKAVQEFVRVNGLDKQILLSKKKSIGIVTTGKAYLDVCQALNDLNIDENNDHISLYKVALSWPMEPQGLKEFANGHKELLVIEEKGNILEQQIQSILYNLPEKNRPLVVGKTDEEGRQLVSSFGEIEPEHISAVIARRFLKYSKSNGLQNFLDLHNKHIEGFNKYEPIMLRTPYYCSGCPHNTSTNIPEGSQGLGGIGCHIMAPWMMPERRTKTFTQMGGEGTTWIGLSPFSKHNHMFVNLGDGTYFHSGLLAIRASVSAKTNITYKILYNDAVAMTGGQPVDGQLTVPQLSQQVAAESVSRICIVSDDIEKYKQQTGFSQLAEFYHRSELEKVQKMLRETPGTSVLIYDQTCAAEKRRRRKRGLMDDPDRRVFINPEICEGCGDCSKASNCVSVLPMETALGTKRQIDQSSCNKDYSCVEGFCPSFVSVRGADIHSESDEGIFSHLKEPPMPKIVALGNRPYGIMVTGIGGTGVITISALIAMAAHIENKGVATLDMTGLAQKGGTVYSYVQIANEQKQIHGPRLADRKAHLVIACDSLNAISKEILGKVNEDTQLIVNEFQTITGSFTQNPDFKIPEKDIFKTLHDFFKKELIHSVNATEVVKNSLGDSMPTNIFMLGFAFQKGLLPFRWETLMQVIELNNVAIDLNKRAFLLGRLLAEDPKFGDLHQISTKQSCFEMSIEDLIHDRHNRLVKYQNKKYANRFLELIKKVQAVDTHKNQLLTKAVIAGAYKLMAYKDEYEVARLYTDGQFSEYLDKNFKGDIKLSFHLAPPIFSKKDKLTGHLKKREFGGWMIHAFRLLAKLKPVRGTVFDIFGYTDERKMERRLILEYFTIVEKILHKGVEKDYNAVVEICQLPEKMRGFGHVKLNNIQKVMPQWKKALQSL